MAPGGLNLAFCVGGDATLVEVLADHPDTVCPEGLRRVVCVGGDVKPACEVLLPHAVHAGAGVDVAAVVGPRGGGIDHDGEGEIAVGA